MVDYKSASYMMAGTACMVVILNNVLWHLGSEGHSLLPGFGFAAGLATPVLCTWLGIILKHWRGIEKLRLIILLSIIGLALLCAISTQTYYFTPNKCLMECLAMTIMGYIIPENHLKALTNKGMITSRVLLCVSSLLIYTCIAVARNRIFLFLSVWEYADMTDLTLSLLQIAETVSAFAAVYFITAVSFSSTGIALGSLKWVRVLLGIFCILTFVRVVVNACISSGLRTFFIVQVIANPVFICLIVWVSKRLKKGAVV
jgi:hypothetical protein